MILIIDNYDSFTYNLVHLIAANTDDYNVARNDKISLEEIGALQPDGILISPGPGRPEDAGIICEMIQKYSPQIPMLGVCLGLQAIGVSFGGKVIHAPKLMHGKTSTVHHDGKGIFQNVEDNFIATRYHSLVLDPENIPPELEITARSSDGVIMGIRHRRFPLTGIQFHPESYLTEYGKQLMSNWMESLDKKRILT